MLGVDVALAALASRLSRSWQNDDHMEFELSQRARFAGIVWPAAHAGIGEHMAASMAPVMT